MFIWNAYFTRTAKTHKSPQWRGWVSNITNNCIWSVPALLVVLKCGVRPLRSLHSYLISFDNLLQTCTTTAFNWIRDKNNNYQLHSPKCMYPSHPSPPNVHINQRAVCGIKILVLLATDSNAIRLASHMNNHHHHHRTGTQACRRWVVTLICMGMPVFIFISVLCTYHPRFMHHLWFLYSSI